MLMMTFQGVEQKDFEYAAQCLRPGQRAADDRRPASDHGLAHNTSTLPQGRASDYYGETPHTWSPYHPSHSRPLADYALDLAKKCLDYEPLLDAFDNERLPRNGNGRFTGCPDR